MNKGFKAVLSIMLSIMILFPSMATAAYDANNVLIDSEDIGVVESFEKTDDNSNKADEIEVESDKTQSGDQEEKSDINEGNEETEIFDESSESLEEKEEKPIIEETNGLEESFESNDGDIIGEKYEIEEYSTDIAMYSVELFEREEYRLKYPSIINSKLLKKKTNSKYEIALAYSDGSYTYLDSADDFEEAKEIAENTVVPYSDEMIIPAVIDSNGNVAYATRTMGRIWKHIGGSAYSKFDINTDLYKDSTLSSTNGYINQGSIDDVPVIEYTDKAAKIQANGYIGWVNKHTSSGNYDLVLVPINQVTNPSHYYSKDGILYHYISSNMTAAANTRGTSIALGPAPEYLQEGIKYLSYDGVYFYSGSSIAQGLDTLIADLGAGHKKNSVNANNPYYNYYNYLPFRSTTSYSANDINKFIEANTDSTSLLWNLGQALVDAQNNYGVNALLSLGVAINESGWGKLGVSQITNNVFGMGAVDSMPEGADKFDKVSDSVVGFAKNFISRGYADPADGRYYGGFLGNKDLGANVKYASDPFWGEKAAAHAFLADYYLSGKDLNNLKDFNSHQLIMYTGSNEVRDKNNTLLYNIYESRNYYGGYIGTTAIVTDKNEKLVNGKYCLEIYPERDTPIYSGGSSNKYHGNYNWNNKGYIEAKNIVFINASKTDILPVDPGYANKWKQVGEKWYYYDNNGHLVKGWKGINGYWYYFDKVTSEMKTGWIYDDGNWSFLNDDGKMATGLITDQGKVYYLNSKGYMQYGWQVVNGYSYFFGSSGAAYTGWFGYNNKWYYAYSDGKIATGLINIDDELYLLSSTGEMLTGWQKYNNSWYYFESSGAAVKGWLKDNNIWYYLNDDCTMATGLKKINNNLYLLGSSGAMLTGWQKYNNSWYYFESSGAAVKGWLKDNNIWYYLNDDCTMATGLKNIDNNLYLLGSSGAMLTGWQKYNGSWYYFMSSGAAKKGWLNLSGKWYYLNNDYKMATGWIEVDGKRYYLYEDGSMASNTTIDGIYVDGSGAAR